MSYTSYILAIEPHQQLVTGCKACLTTRYETLLLATKPQMTLTFLQMLTILSTKKSVANDVKNFCSKPICVIYVRHENTLFYYTKYYIQCHLLFRVTQCHVSFLYTSYYTDKCRIGCLDF